jgi:hypothetical protein
MSEITTPADVIAELNRLMAESQKGIAALYEAEVKVAQLDAEHTRAEAFATLESGGTAIERTAQARLETYESKLALDIAKAELNRVKQKLRAIESAQVATAVIAKQVEVQWRTA